MCASAMKCKQAQYYSLFAGFTRTGLCRCARQGRIPPGTDLFALRLGSVRAVINRMHLQVASRPGLFSPLSPRCVYALHAKYIPPGVRWTHRANMKRGCGSTMYSLSPPGYGVLQHSRKYMIHLCGDPTLAPRRFRSRSLSLFLSFPLSLFLRGSLFLEPSCIIRVTRCIERSKKR